MPSLPKITFIAAEFPFPPNHGGRADTWQRLRAFSRAGLDIQLICWYSDRRGGAPTEEEMSIVRGIVREMTVLPIDLGGIDLIWRLVNLWRMPSHASARLPRRAGRKKLLNTISAFSPAAIWLDGLWPAAFARDAARQLGIPYFYRSHNIEHRYMARQQSLARDPVYRMRLALTLVGLEAFEHRVVMAAAQVFDISVDDLAFWRARGLRSGQWLPPIVQVDTSPQLRNQGAATAMYDVVFVGNLHTPNNVEGLRWLLLNVWPRVLSRLPTATALIAGSAPTQEVVALAASSKGVELRADPRDVWPLYRSARVLVNPARSGSGVNIKSVEMLQFDQPIVSTRVGAGGLPEEIRREFLVEDEPEAFADAVLKAISSEDGLVDLNARSRARRAFTPDTIQSVIAEIRRGISQAPLGAPAIP